MKLFHRANPKYDVIDFSQHKKEIVSLTSHQNYVFSADRSGTGVTEFLNPYVKLRLCKYLALWPRKIKRFTC